MTQKFDPDEAEKFLRLKEEKEQKAKEEERKAILARTISVLQEKFQDSKVEVYLVGSIIKPFSFSSRSDVDIVLKNYSGDRFELWGQLEEKIGRPVEIIIYETCHFQEFINKEGLKVI